MRSGLDMVGGGLRRGLAVIALGVLATSTVGCSRHRSVAAAPTGRQTPSGLTIPRYVSTKFGTVNARGGPGDDYRLDWVYRVKGLPLQVVAETQDWRRVCGPDGAVAWVHKRTVAERRTVMRTDPNDLTLLRRPDLAAEPVATLLGHALADLKSCQNGWCKISVAHASGWVRADQIWGAFDGPQCRSS